MSIIKFKPTSPGRRNASALRNPIEQLKLKPIKEFLRPVSKKGGRNVSGSITVRSRGGGHKKKLRLLSSCSQNITGVVESVEYSPLHSSGLIRVLNSKIKKRFYVRAPENISLGDRIGPGVRMPNSGSFLHLSAAPIGSLLFSLEINNTYQLACAAGCFVRVLQKRRHHVKVQLPSGAAIWIKGETFAISGIGGNSKRRFIKKGKAGKNRWLGRRPVVRGVAMNPIDHPHGGGEGKTSGGRPSVSAWGRPAHGVRTAKKHKTKSYGR